MRSMDAKGQQTNQSIPPANPVSTPPINQGVGNDQPGSVITDSQAQAILEINNLQARQQPKNKFPIKYLIITAFVIVLTIIASFFMGSFNSTKKTNSSGLTIGLPKQSNATSGRGVSNQINQDVKACSNPVNAALIC